MATIGTRRSICTSVRASYAPAASCFQAEKWVVCSMPAASSVRSATRFGMAVRRRVSTTPWNGCTAGMSGTVSPPMQPEDRLPRQGEVVPRPTPQEYATMQDADTRLDQLGRLEDLPQVYRDALKHQNLVPLWPSLRALLPPHAPVRQTQS